MKLVILVDSNTNSFESMVSLVDDKNITIIDTERCDAPHEYKHLVNAINEFSKSKSEIMLGKFSGREDVIKELGDECSEMILALSSDRNSRHYAEQPVTLFSDLIRTFEKETILT